MDKHRFRLNKTNKNLIYLVAFGEYDIKLAKMLIHSLRKTRYIDDIFVLTNMDISIDTCTIINVIKDPKIEQFKHEGKLYHKRNNEKYNFLMLKTCPYVFIDIKAYNNVIYIDNDFLFFRNINEIIGRCDEIIVQKDSLRVREQLSRVPQLIERYCKDVPEWQMGACSGFVRTPSNAYQLLYDWNTFYKEQLTYGNTEDQLALNVVLFRDKKYSFSQANGISYNYNQNIIAVHYWQELKNVMEHDYNTFINK